MEVCINYFGFSHIQVLYMSIPTSDARTMVRHFWLVDHLVPLHISELEIISSDSWRWRLDDFRNFKKKNLFITLRAFSIETYLVSSPKPPLCRLYYISSRVGCKVNLLVFSEVICFSFVLYEVMYQTNEKHMTSEIILKSNRVGKLLKSSKIISIW